MNKAVTAWCSSIHKIVTRSVTESEYSEITEACEKKNVFMQFYFLWKLLLNTLLPCTLIIGGTAQSFFIIGKNPISENLKIGPTIFDIWWLVKSPFDRVIDRNVRNGKTPVIGIASPLPEIQLVHAPPHALAVSKRNSGKCMFPGGSRACSWQKFAIAYVRAPLLLV